MLCNANILRNIRVYMYINILTNQTIKRIIYNLKKKDEILTLIGCIFLF